MHISTMIPDQYNVYLFYHGLTLMPNYSYTFYYGIYVYYVSDNYLSFYTIIPVKSFHSIFYILVH